MAFVPVVGQGFGAMTVESTAKKAANVATLHMGYVANLVKRKLAQMLQVQELLFKCFS